MCPVTVIWVCGILQGTCCCVDKTEGVPKLSLLDHMFGICILLQCYWGEFNVIHIWISWGFCFSVTFPIWVLVLKSLPFRPERNWNCYFSSKGIYYLTHAHICIYLEYFTRRERTLSHTLSLFLSLSLKHSFWFLDLLILDIKTNPIALIHRNWSE